MTRFAKYQSLVITILMLICFNLLTLRLSAQTPDSLFFLPEQVVDTLSTYRDSTFIVDSTLLFHQDSAQINQNIYQTQPANTRKAVIDQIINSKSADSMIINPVKKKIYLFNNCVIDYGNIHLESGFAEIDMETMQLRATGIVNDAGKLEQKPLFKDVDQEFRAEIIEYNFKTSKGYISNVITQQGDGYLHGQTIKKLDDGVINTYKGSYTTCDLEHPHFQFRFNKGKVIPNDKIVAGVTYLEIEDIPTPLAVPFAIVPLMEDKTSGIIIPDYGNSQERGFFLENGGYYWSINDYFDLKLLGDIYTRGSWALKPSMNYKKRYKFSGSFGLSFAVNKTGIKGTSGYNSRNDFKIVWKHTQDPKARPNSTFSANVNFVTSSYNKYNPSSTTDYLSNTFKSSIAYQTSFANKKINLSLNAGHSQNTLTNSMTFTLPDFSLSVSKLYPFKRKKQIGGTKWYEKINFTYSMVGKNEITSIDSLLLKEPVLDKMKNGIKHTANIGFNSNLFKVLNFTLSAKYVERWYSKYADAYYVADTTFVDGIAVAPHLQVDPVYAFKAARDFNFNTSLGTTLYGLVQFKKGFLRAVRHVLTPSLSFNYTPDFGTDFWKNYNYYEDVRGDWVKYSIYNVGDFSSLYGYPTDGTSGKFNIAFGNSLEIKVRSKNDTITGMKKIKLIESLNFSTGYDVAKDSLNWSPLAISGRTSLVKGLNLTYSTQLSPYKVNENGKTIDEFIWKTEKRLFAPPSQTWSLGFSYNLNSNTFKNKNKKNKSPSNPSGMSDVEEVIISPYEYIDWNNAWNVAISYNFSYIIKNVMTDGEYVKKITKVNTINLNGNVNITPKWKVTYNTSFDIQELELTYVNLSVYRDLHCWEMSFNWIPFGGHKSWSFTINAKAGMLNSLKYEKKEESFRDSL